MGVCNVPSNNGMPWNLTSVACASRLQGVHKIVIYDDASEDESLLLQELYSQRGRHYLKMHPLSAIVEIPDTAEYGVRLEKQTKAFRHCLEHEADNMEWILVADVDEYVWSPKYSTISEFLGSEDIGEHWGSVGVQMSISGMLDDTEFYAYKVEREEDGSVRLTNEHGPQLLLEDMVQRGPDARLGEPEALIKDNITICTTGWCDHGPVKSFARKDHVKDLGVHNHGMNDGWWTLYAGMELVTGRHFSIISEADLQRRRHSSRSWVFHGDGTIEDWRACAKTFFRAVTDRTLQQGFAHRLRQEIGILLSPHEAHTEKGHPEGSPHPETQPEP